MSTGRRQYGALIFLALLLASFLSAFGAEDALTGRREVVLAKCEELARPLGLSSSAIKDDVWQAKTEAELSSILQSCRQELGAYPSRSVSQLAMARGRELYNSSGCTVCHGKDGRGGDSGPSLLRSQRVMRDKNGEQIGEILLNGVPNTPMPAFHLTPEQVSDIAEFLHALQSEHLEASRNQGPQLVEGDIQTGKVLFNAKCTRCHSTSGDLKGIGTKYSDLRTLQQQWLIPREPPASTAIVSTADGSSEEGQILRIDEFLVTLKLKDGSRRTVLRKDLDSDVEVHDPLSEHKALLSSYTDEDVHNITSYLHTLVSSPIAANVPFFDPSNASQPSAPRGRQTSSAVPPSDFSAKRLLGSWPTYSGDYSGRRYSLLSQINQSNIRHLTLAWSSRLRAGPENQGGYPARVGGEGRADQFSTTEAEVRGSVLEVNGVLYVTTADNAWALDAQDGEILWHFFWKSRGGWHTFGSRGPALWKTFLYFETPDDYLVSLDASTGNERWHVQVASLEEQYFASIAPVVIGNHVLVGAGNTLNAPGFLQSFDPETGQLQWKHYSVPMNKGDPGIDTWKDLDAAKHGGGQVWMPGVYDAKTQLYIYGTGNPTPAYTAKARGDGDALFTCSMIAVEVDSGKLAWYYQTSPNDTHDWDSAQTPVLADLTFDGRRREVAMTAARNGYFFVIDRITGERILSKKFSATANWAEPLLNDKGQPIRRPEKDGSPSGALVSNENQGATNWQPASYSPDYGLFFVSAADSWALYYRTDTDAGGAYSMEGKEETPLERESYLKAIEPKTGNVKWSVRYPSGGSIANGVLTTAGRLLFSGDTDGNLVARNPGTGHPLWHAQIGQVSNAPETYLIDGRQYILVAARDTLYAFRLQ